MRVRHLTRPEQTVLVALARHLVHLDGTLSDAELFELIRLGIEIGKQDYAADLAATDAIHIDRGATLAAAATVGRTEARATIATELGRIAHCDGLHPSEQAFLDALGSIWA